MSALDVRTIDAARAQVFLAFLVVDDDDPLEAELRGARYYLDRARARLRGEDPEDVPVDRPPIEWIGAGS